MPTYVLPDLNILCNIYTGNGAPGSPATGVPVTLPRHANVPCALVYGRRTNVAASGGTTLAGIPVLAMNLLLGVGADIRGPQDSVSNDLVECPAGSGRYYWVSFVDDIGRGHPNEHRTAAILAVSGGWTAPYP